MPDLSAIIAKAKRNVPSLEGVADEGLSRVSRRNPVDTGNSRSRWRKTASGDYIYVTNDAPYIRALEYGHSAQAPNGMVRRTMAEMPDIARGLLNAI